jgi:hypothetical protein|tara:strand:+ start:1850 stop:2983 length:1134 start_codon:yes stop_codon:yes gene_type:complete
MKDKLVKRFVIGTFVSLYALVSIISTIHVIDFFELSNPYWLAVTLAIGFEIGAAASLASLVILKKMNRTIVWSLFIAITLMQMQGNMYYAFINLEDFTGWSELFDLIEEDLIDQKRILAFVSGAILPLIALGFIKSLVDYIKPEEEDEIISEGILGDLDNEISNTDGFDTIPSDEFFEDILDKPVTGPFPDINEEDDLAAWRELSSELNSKHEYDAYVDRQEPGSWLKNPPEEEFDEDHALDEVLNDMVGDMTQAEIDEIANSKFEVEDTHGNVEVIDPKDNDDKELDIQDFEEDDEIDPPNDELVNAAERYKEASIEFQEPNPTSVGAIVQKIATPHLPTNEEIKSKSQNELWNEAMDRKAKKDMEDFIKNKNANK